MTTTYVTGDLHGDVDGRFSERNLERAGVAPGDLLVVLGDTGVLWNTSPADWARGEAFVTDTFLISDLARAWPGDVAFIDGNHDNHPVLASLRTEGRWGGEVGVVCDGLYHLRRGGSYDLPAGDGTARAWCMGGAWSIDRDWRSEGVDWWPEEVPSEEEIDAARASLEREGWGADFVLTHECPASMRDALTRDSPFGPVDHTDRLQEFLDDVDERAGFDRWYCGHYHVDRDVGSCHTCLYTAVVPLGAPAGES